MENLTKGHLVDNSEVRQPKAVWRRMCQWAITARNESINVVSRPTEFCFSICDLSDIEVISILVFLKQQSKNMKLAAHEFVLI